MWHVTCDTWPVMGGEYCVKFQVPSSNDLGSIVFWIFWGKGWLDQWISDRGVCRTARATPGLLIIEHTHVGPCDLWRLCLPKAFFCTILYIFLAWQMHGLWVHEYILQQCKKIASFICCSINYCCMHIMFVGFFRVCMIRVFNRPV